MAAPLYKLQALALLLGAERPEASVEYPGYIAFPHALTLDAELDPAIWSIGDADGDWGADLTLQGGDPIFSITLAGSAGWPLDLVARELLAAIRKQEAAS